MLTVEQIENTQTYSYSDCPDMATSNIPNSSQLFLYKQRSLFLSAYQLSHHVKAALWIVIRFEGC